MTVLALLSDILEMLETAEDGAAIEELYEDVLEDELSPVEGELDVPDRLDEENPMILDEIIDDPVLDGELLVATLDVAGTAVAVELEDPAEERLWEAVGAELAEDGETVLDVWLKVGDVFRAEVMPELDALVVGGWLDAVLEVGTLDTEGVLEELLDEEGDTGEEVVPEVDVLVLGSGVEDVVEVGTADRAVALVDEEEAACEELMLKDALEICPVEVKDVLYDGL